MQGIIHSCLSENPKVPHIMSDLSVSHEGEGKLSFHFKNIYKNSKWQAEGKNRLCFELVHSSTIQSFMVDTLNPTV
jgi:hypothetical protein